MRFFRLPEPLAPYFTALYLTSIDARGVQLKDYLHPEWAALRFTEGPPPAACVGPGPLVPQWPFVACGPTSLATRFAVTTSRIWGLGLQPTGWAKFARGEASALANRTVDGSADPAFALLAPILALIRGNEDDDAKAARIGAYLTSIADRPVPREDRIFALHDALRDPLVGEVSTLQARLGMSVKALERLCRRYFGFTPKLLLRRQRFVRSLARFMLDPSLSWLAALDGQYHDQAQFVREFRGFMGISPSEYAAMAHPIVGPLMRQQLADQGAATSLDLPTIARFRVPHGALAGVPAG